MLSLRSFTRAMPKVLARPVAVRTGARSLSLQSALRASRSQPRLAISSGVSRIGATQVLARKAFSTSVALKEELSEGSTDQELSATLESELQLESESTDATELPAELQEFLTSEGFQLQDTPGNEEVVLTKTFGPETIRISFTVADLATEHDPDTYLQDRALQDESFDELESPDAKKNINVGNPNKFAQAPEDALTQSERAEAGVEEPASGMDEAGFPVNLNVTITKPGATSGALFMSVVAHDGAVALEQVHYFQDAAAATAPTADVQWGARNLYTGPPFANLDTGLQEVMERYLEERGINTQLALWVPEFVEWKEQREYMAWLQSMKDFVDA